MFIACLVGTLETQPHLILLTTAEGGTVLLVRKLKAHRLNELAQGQGACQCTRAHALTLHACSHLPESPSLGRKSI